MTEGPLSAEDFGPAFKAFLEQAIKAVPAEEPFFISRLRDHFAGRALRLIEPSCAMARILQPSMVVLEDADLVAEERTARDRGPQPRFSSSFSTRWTAWRRMPTSSSCSPQTEPTSWSRLWPQGPDESIRPSSSPSRTRRPDGVSCSCTLKASIFGSRALILGWSGRKG